MKSLAQRILSFNAGRDPVTLALKYDAMRQNAFRFYRGACHLFYEDLVRLARFDDPTRCWISGDLHLENFGSYKGANRLVYFDLNDFDESVLAPATWDLSRFLTSILITCTILKMDEATGVKLSKEALERYTKTLKGGKPRVIENETTKGVVKKYLDQVGERKNKDFIKSRTVKDGSKRKLLIDKTHTLGLLGDIKKEVSREFEKCVAEQTWFKNYKVSDIATRIAGTGSLGVERYVLLAGSEKDDHYILLDLKQEVVSSLAPYLTLPQPHWKSETERVIKIQDRVQHVSPALMTEIDYNQKSFRLRELQPTEDKMDFTLCDGKFENFEYVLGVMAELIASGQLRSGGRQGSSHTDALIDFANQPAWQKEIIEYAVMYSRQTVADWKTFSADYDAGVFGKPSSGSKVKKHKTEAVEA